MKKIQYCIFYNIFSTHGKYNYILYRYLIFDSYITSHMTIVVCIKCIYNVYTRLSNLNKYIHIILTFHI